jgi:hypothetical protein
MKDNSIHWFNLVAQSDYYWNHIDIFSLAAFTNTLFGKILPGFVYQLPLLIAIFLSFLLIMIGDRRKRLELSILLTMALTLTFFLSYNTVWEYQFTLFFPAVALLFLLQEKESFFRKWIPLLLAISSFLYLPSLYFLFRGRAIDDFLLNLVRLDKIIPALIIYIILVVITGGEILKEAAKKT